MERRYIKKICECYYYDYDLNKRGIWKDKESAINEIYEEVQLLFDNLYLEEQDIYRFIAEESNSFKQKFLYKLISTNIVEKYNSEILEIFSNMDENIKEDPYEVMDYYYEILNKFEDDKIITEMLMTAVSSVLFTLAAYWAISQGWKTISRAQWRIFTSFNNVAQDVAKLIESFTKAARIKNVLFLSNVEECWRKCGINPDRLEPFVGSVLQRQHDMNFMSKFFATNEDIEQADCLGACYLRWCIQQAKVLAQGYGYCLQNSGALTGNLDAIQIFIQPPSVNTCKDYYQLLRKHRKGFKEVAEVIFGPREILVNQAVQQYETNVYNSLTMGKGRKMGYKELPGISKNDDEKNTSKDNNSFEFNKNNKYSNNRFNNNKFNNRNN
jgi:hypothetical protein